MSLPKLIQSLLFISGLAFFNLSYGEVVGTWKVEGSTPFKVYYKNDKRLRMDVGNGTYMLVVDDKAYSVMNQGGQLMVMDMSAMGGAMQAFGGMAMGQAQSQAEKYDPNSVTINKTGKTEVIAGIKGDVYKVTVKGPNGMETTEFVASTNKEVVTLQKAFHLISQRMAQSMMNDKMLAGFDRYTDMVEERNIGGMMRYGNHMTLQSVANEDVPDTLFEIPKNATMMSIPGFGR